MLDVRGQLIRVKVNLAQVPAGIAGNLVGEVRGSGIAALATSHHCHGLHARTEFDHRDEAIAACAVIAFCPRPGFRAERGQAAPLCRSEGTGTDLRASSKCGAIESSSLWKRLISFHGVCQLPKSRVSRSTAAARAASLASGLTRVPIYSGTLSLSACAKLPTSRHRWSPQNTARLVAVES